MSRPKQTQSLVRLDPERLDQALRRLAMSKSEFADELDGSVSRDSLSRSTIIKAFAGKPVRIRTARALAEALGVADVHDLIHASEKPKPDPEPEVCGEWEVESQAGGWFTESNDLQYRICRMRHRFIAGRLGRGKEYDLGDSATRERERIENYLCRHAAVSEKLHGDPHVVETLNTFPANDGKSWWVIDRFVAGRTLAESIQSGPLERADLARVMRDVLDGLGTLHQAGIVFRELAPRRVLIADEDGRTLLTDFELAKLLDSEHSVSTSWPDNPWRAPEVGNGQVDARADLYSWARLLVEAATGHLPPPGQDLDALLMAGLPKAVWRVATDCLSPFPDDRPRTVAQVRKRLTRWC